MAAVVGPLGQRPMKLDLADLGIKVKWLGPRELELDTREAMEACGRINEALQLLEAALDAAPPGLRACFKVHVDVDTGELGAPTRQPETETPR